MSNGGSDTTPRMACFSNRVPNPEHELNRLTTTVADLRRRGVSLLDLTGTNPTRAGLDYPTRVLDLLGRTGSVDYDPNPLGLPSAREAVVSTYPTRGRSISPDDVMLTASTSEAYSFLFKLLCRAGDEVLVPVPSYPLFEHLARLDEVRLQQYALEYHGRWAIDVDDAARRIGPRTRALIVVAPNNPTGSLVRADDWAAVSHLCASRGIAIVCDEVFGDYLLEPDEDGIRGVLTVSGPDDLPLIFSLGGFSKALALPQLKLSWMIVSGPRSDVASALERLRWIGDTYLSVGTAVQKAAPALVACRPEMQKVVRSRLETNLATLRARAAGSPSCTVLRVEGGWSAVLRVPVLDGEESFCEVLASQDHVVVHPGFFYDFPRPAYVVVSLLTPPDAFADGIDRVCRRVETWT